MKTIIIAAAAAMSLAACSHERAVVDRRAEVINNDANAASSTAVKAGHNADNGMKSKTGAVGDLDVGRSINAKGDIADRTQQFNVGDPVYASIDSDHLVAGTLTATLKCDGALVSTQSAELKSGQENVSFNMGAAQKAGSYVLTVSSASAGEIESQSFMVGNFTR